jgi:serine/threonine protein kinase/tetratricopeptide (TPR) repeat protein
VILNQYEEIFHHDRSIDPVAFAGRYPDIPHDILSQELIQLRDELQADQLESVSYPKHAGRFSIIKTLRSGGMGVVYLAYDHDCNRQVAVKKIRPEFRNDPVAIRRFHAEAELTAELEHPGIIPIYAKSVDTQGEYYYAMRLIRQCGASTLAVAVEQFHEELSRATRLEQGHRVQYLDQFRQLIRILIHVVDTIAYTHSQGIVHRDLKPSNVLLGPYGETLIADWGLAKKIDDPLDRDSTDSSGNSITRLDRNPDESKSSTSGVGTPGYAAPEMSQGIDNASLRLADIYSLGATLQCILQGSSPSESSPEAIVDRKTMVKLAELSPTIRYLEAIARKAMANDISKRYLSAQELGIDLQNWISGEPISARRAGYWEQSVRWISRHRTAATGLASALVITFVGVSCFLWYQSTQKSLLDRQAKQLRLALDKSASLLVETRDAKTQAEKANEAAQEGRKIAIKSQEIAQKRESLTFEGLLRVQDILLANQAAFQTESLKGVQEQLVTQTKETFAGILDNLSENSSAQPQTLRYLQVLTHRLSAMERLAGRPEQALKAIDQACSWMQRCLSFPDLPEDIELDLQRRIGELRSLQGNIALLSNMISKAEPAVEESISRLSGVIQSDRLGDEDRKEAVAALVQSYTSRSSIAEINGQVDKAKAELVRALELLETQQPNSSGLAMAKAQAHYGMALLQSRSQEFAEASKQYEQASNALVLAEKLSHESMSMEFILYRSQLAFHRSSLLLSHNQRSQAIEILNQQMQYDTQAVQRFRANPMILDAYQRTAIFLQGLYVQTGQESNAVDLCRSWGEIADGLLSESPLSASAIDCAIHANHLAGHLDQQMNRSEEAQRRYRKALAIYEKAAVAQIATGRLAQQKVELEMHLLELHYQIGADDQAESIFERALQATLHLKEITQPDSQVLASAIEQLQRCIDIMRMASDLKSAEWAQTSLKSKGMWRDR